MIKIGKTTISEQAGGNHTLDEFKKLFGKIPDLRNTDLEKLYYELGGKRKTVKKQNKEEESKE